MKPHQEEWESDPGNYGDIRRYDPERDVYTRLFATIDATKEDRKLVAAIPELVWVLQALAADLGLIPVTDELTSVSLRSATAHALKKAGLMP